MTKPIVLLIAGLLVGAVEGEEPRTNAAPSPFSIHATTEAVEIKNERGATILVYQLQRPASHPSLQSGCYFHPFTTPGGTILTDVAPSDHPHHRGIFLAWVEMKGAKPGDFWGWGEHAPTKDRRIVHRRLLPASNPQGDAGKAVVLVTDRNHAAFRALNEWVAEDITIMEETLSASVSGVAMDEAKTPNTSAAGGNDTRPGAYVLDLEYRLVPKIDLELAQWAFSGFCVRTRKEGKITAVGPAGVVNLPKPVHTKPASDWPAAPWYGYTVRLPDDKPAGIAVIDHPANPPSLWHNHTDVRMLNPCIVAPAAVKLIKEKPLVLRYRVVAHDGEISGTLLNRLSREFGDAKEPND